MASKRGVVSLGWIESVISASSDFMVKVARLRLRPNDGVAW